MQSDDICVPGPRPQAPVFTAALNLTALYWNHTMDTTDNPGNPLMCSGGTVDIDGPNVTVAVEFGCTGCVETPGAGAVVDVVFEELPGGAYFCHVLTQSPTGSPASSRPTTSPPTSTPPTSSPTNPIVTCGGTASPLGHPCHLPFHYPRNGTLYQGCTTEGPNAITDDSGARRPWCPTGNGTHAGSRNGSLPYKIFGFCDCTDSPTLAPTTSTTSPTAPESTTRAPSRAPSTASPILPTTTPAARGTPTAAPTPSTPPPHGQNNTGGDSKDKDPMAIKYLVAGSVALLAVGLCLLAKRKQLCRCCCRRRPQPAATYIRMVDNDVDVELLDIQADTTDVVTSPGLLRLGGTAATGEDRPATRGYTVDSFTVRNRGREGWGEGGMGDD